MLLSSSSCTLYESPGRSRSEIVEASISPMPATPKSYFDFRKSTCSNFEKENQTLERDVRTSTNTSLTQSLQ